MRQIKFLILVLFFISCKKQAGQSFGRMGSTPIGVTRPVLVYGLGDSFMAGTNSTSLDSTWFGRLCHYKGWTPKNLGVGGQAITCGGTQACFSATNIPVKSGVRDMLIVNWTLNDAVMVYSVTPTRSMSQVITSVASFLSTAMNNTYKYLSQDVIWVTGWHVGTNSYYTQAQVTTMSNKIDSICTANGVVCVKNFTNYPMNADSVHPQNDAAYRNIFNQLKVKLGY